MNPKAERSIAALRGDYSAANVTEAVALLKVLRNDRDYESLLALGEAVGRVAPGELVARRWYAQALIETGKASVAVDVLEALKARLPGKKKTEEWIEATGILGRAYKQMYFDARIRGTDAAQRALRGSIAAYRAAYKEDAANAWTGVNLLALVEHCRRSGISYPKAIKPKELASELLATLEATPPDKRDAWHLATTAEASIATDDWGTIESSLVNYSQAPDVEAFHLEGTRRQLADVWKIDDDPRGKAMLDVLAAALLRKNKGALLLPTNQVNGSRPSTAQFEAVLGPNKGMQTKRWWETALKRARAVVAVHKKNAERYGTGFLAKASDLGLQGTDATLVVTNCHVVNEKGEHSGLRPDDAEVVFEAVDDARPYAVKKVLWSSPPDECDASILVLEPSVADIEPLPIARALPVLEPESPQPQVYVIGHPGGRELTFSFQYNQIIDHEGPENGRPTKADRCLIHYETSTEGGSSGSPVFNSSWDVIGLHHKGGTLGMPRLNGKEGTYGANEGVWMQSIIARMKAEMR